MNKLTADMTSLRVRNSSARALFAAIGLASLSLLAANANANPIGYADMPSERVDFEDLDLAKEADTKRLYRRLRSAANQVCSAYSDQGRMVRSSARTRCESEALASAVEAIGHPALTTLYSTDPQTKLAQRSAKSSSNS
jgi:UrcA family protein